MGIVLLFIFRVSVVMSIIEKVSSFLMIIGLCGLVRDCGRFGHTVPQLCWGLGASGAEFMFRASV